MLKLGSLVSLCAPWVLLQGEFTPPTPVMDSVPLPTENLLISAVPYSDAGAAVAYFSHQVETNLHLNRSE